MKLRWMLVGLGVLLLVTLFFVAGGGSVFGPSRSKGSAGAGGSTASPGAPGSESVAARAEQKRKTDRSEKADKGDLISQVSLQIIGELKKHELDRSKLVSETEDERSFKYEFSIANGGDLKAFTDELASRLSKENGISKAAVQMELEEKLLFYQIPSGLSKTVRVEVPKDPLEPLSYSSADMDKDPATGATTVHNFESGKVPVGINRWRYDQLLDLTDYKKSVQSGTR